MSTDTNETGDHGGNEKIDVRVPTALLEVIDETYEERGYTSRSEAIRDALHNWAAPPVQLSDDTLDDLTESRRQRERGDTRSLDEVAEQFGVDLDD